MKKAEEILDNNGVRVYGAMRVRIVSSMETYKNTHGGNRPNSGRKKKPETKTLSFRVAKDKAEELKSLISAYIKSLI